MQDELHLRDDFPEHSEAEWRQAVEALLKGKPLEKLIRGTDEGIRIQPMYFASALEGLPAVDAQPGLPPFVRGTHAARDPEHPWAVAQEIPYPDPAEFGAAARHDLARGQDTLVLPLDVATRLGHSPAEARPEDVGAEGMSLAMLQDLAVALEGVDLAKVPLIVHPGPSGLPAAALLVALHESRGGRPRDLRGVVAADPIGHLARFGVLPASIGRTWLELAQLTAWTRDFAPALSTIAVPGQVWREAGGSAVQELGFALATAVEQIRRLGELGLDVNEVAPRMAMFLSVGSDFFMELAKMRAARLVWARMVDAYGGSEPAQRLQLHLRTLRWNKTVTDPWVNLLRVTTEAFSAVCGGADSIHVAPLDEPVGLPTEFSRRIARNLHLVLREETHAGATVDPAGGAYYVEALTEEVARKAWALMQEVESRGGIVEALEAGFVQSEVAAVSAARDGHIGQRRVAFVGTSKYPNLQERSPEAHPIDWEALRALRREAVIRARAEVDPGPRQMALLRLANQSDTPHAMEAAVGAVRAGATLDDLICALRGDDPTAVAVTPLEPRRGATGFERLRASTARFAAAHGGRAPRVFLANLGPLPKHKPRTDFARGFFELAGLTILSPDGVETPGEAAEAWAASGAEVVCICSSDDLYPDTVPPLARALKGAAPPPRVYLAGWPKEHLEAFRQAGVDDFIHLRSNALEQLEALQVVLGVRS